ncbi:hypothetical protein QJS04_geneDACA006847 [Acorus gramineus]|uniref:Uncharacterized protein n=1 Tax=Acorus gramineus TaxID=55184 RepID=A0AAV9AXL9_ACOGR|nr:hypothetical protein QJS04_geneDACA006847 [Acorus gramineus]
MLISWFQKHLSITARHLCCSYFPSQPPTLFRHFKPKTLACFSTHKRNPATKSSNFETLTPVQKQQISLYVETLLQWNQRMNLTAVRDVDEVMSRHVADSLAILPPINNSYCDASSSDGLRLVDVGSGAGLPGLILAIACPDWKITLLESMQKRCRFLEHAVDLVGLTNVQIICGRAEDRVWAKLLT